jgi:4-hydroxy-tetrahydrodipicolinate synthase
MAGVAERLHGIIPPVCTPLTEDFEVDVPSLERLVGFLLDGGVHGLFALGTTSENMLLTDRQRATAIEAIVEAAAGRVPVIAGVIDTATAAATEHAHVAQRLGVDGLVLTAPFYLRPSQAEVVSHFRAVRMGVDLPILAYDIPSAVPTKLARATVLAMAREGLIVGLKDSSGDEANFRALLLEAGALDGFATFTGSELLVDLTLIAGASGAVPGLANVDPAGFVRVYDAVRAGDLATAHAEQARLARLFALVHAGDPARMGFTASFLGAFKTALVLRGVIATNVVGRPLTRYDEADADRVRAILDGVGLL